GTSVNGPSLRPWERSCRSVRPFCDGDPGTLNWFERSDPSFPVAMPPSASKITHVMRTIRRWRITNCVVPRTRAMLRSRDPRLVTAGLPEQRHHGVDEALVAVGCVASGIGEHHPAGLLAEVADRSGRELDVEVRRQLAT